MSTAIATHNPVARPFLARVLMADAAVCGAMGLALMAAAGPLEGLLGLPATLLLVVGLSLLPLAALMAYLGTRPVVRRKIVWALVAYDLLWVAESIGLLMTGWVEPTPFGTAFVIAQALAVSAFAELKFIGLRRATNGR